MQADISVEAVGPPERALAPARQLAPVVPLLLVVVAVGLTGIVSTLYASRFDLHQSSFLGDFDALVGRRLLPLAGSLLLFVVAASRVRLIVDEIGLEYRAWGGSAVTPWRNVAWVGPYPGPNGEDHLVLRRPVAWTGHGWLGRLLIVPRPVAAIPLGRFDERAWRAAIACEVPRDLIPDDQPPNVPADRPAPGRRDWPIAGSLMLAVAALGIVEWIVQRGSGDVTLVFCIAGVGLLLRSWRWVIAVLVAIGVALLALNWNWWQREPGWMVLFTLCVSSTPTFFAAIGVALGKLFRFRAIWRRPPRELLQSGARLDPGDLGQPARALLGIICMAAGLGMALSRGTPEVADAVLILGPIALCLWLRSWVWSVAAAGSAALIVSILLPADFLTMMNTGQADYSDHPMALIVGLILVIMVITIGRLLSIVVGLRLPLQPPPPPGW